MILAEVPRETLVENRQKPKVLDAHQIGRMTESRQDEAIGKQSNGAVMVERYTTTNGRETDGDLQPIKLSRLRGERTQGAKPMRVMTVGSITKRPGASMFATDAVSRNLAKEKLCRSMDNFCDRIIADVLYKRWKPCGAAMKEIGGGIALIVISCHGNRSE